MRRKMNRMKAMFAGFSTIMVFIVLMAIGWIANIVQIVLAAGGEPLTVALDVVMLLKIVGIIAAPLGALMGWIGFFV